MNAVTTTEPLSADTLAHVLGTGDLSKLTTQQRVEYYGATCRSLGLNPLTRPFRFLKLNDQIQLYATKDCTDQLRTIRGISLHIVDRQIDGDLFTVTARARTKDGREDEDIGAVTLPKFGDPRANALMKGTTKAKRRVTLSICGLGGMPDESELDTMPGAVVFDAEDDLPIAPIRDAREQMNRDVPLKAAASPMPRAARIAERAPAYEAPPPRSTAPQERTDAQWKVWTDKLRDACATLYHRSEVVQVAERPSVADALATGPAWVRDEVSAILADNYKRFAAEEPEAEELPDVEIAGADKILAG